MDAIVELIVALIGGFLTALASFLMAVATLLGFAFELLFLVLTQGLSAAKERNRQRKEERPVRALHAQTADPKVADSSAESAPTPDQKNAVIVVVLTVFITILGLAAWTVSDRIRKQRIAATRLQVTQRADSFAEELKGGENLEANIGTLRDRDSWKQPLELFVDKALLGSLIVVRSSGPDRTPGSLDDILATRVIRASAKEVGGELANRGVKALRERVANLLPGGDQEQLPQDIDVEEK